MNNSVKQYLENLAAGKDTDLKNSLFENKAGKDKATIFIGAGTCGLGAGAAKTKAAIEEYLKNNKMEADIVEVGCIGFCAVEPIMDVRLPGKNRISFGKVTFDKVNDILGSVTAGTINSENLLGQFMSYELKPWPGVNDINQHSFFVKQKRLVLKNCGIINPVSFEEYISRGGYAGFIKAVKTLSPEDVISTIEKSGLRGRGGGGFPTGTKWRLAFKTQSDQKYMICNADEGDPGAFMDRAVIEGDPHRLLEGLAIGAYAIGATVAYIYIRAEYPLAIQRLKIAIKQAEEYGLLGHNIMNSGFDLKIKIKMGAGAFVCGEETALMHSIEGFRGMPSPRPPFPAESGLFGKPSVINNVETYANVSEILVKGAEWFSSTGTEKSKGTKVFALSGNVKNTGLVEIPMGTTVRQIIFDIAGGIAFDKKFKAVQIGGPSGGCITEENLDIQIDYQNLIAAGAMMGSGGLVVMDENTCMVDIAKFFMDFIQRESCGKCIPCREGTKRMLEILQSITSKPKSDDNKDALERFQGVMQLEKLAKVIKETSLCGLGQTAPNPVLSTLRFFRHEYEAHVFERVCPAGKCTDLRKFHIIVDKCTGCTACSKKCPTSAIIGTRKAPHFIQENKCIGCGACYETCKFEAIEMI